MSEHDIKILSLSSQLTFLENGGNDDGILMVEQDLNPVLSGSKAHASPQPEDNTD